MTLYYYLEFQKDSRYQLQAMRYNSINSYLKEKFGEKVYKVSLEIDVTCPVRDGSKGTDGCLFCSSKSVEPLSPISSSQEIKEQLQSGIKYIKKRHGAGKFIAYFQNHSNTYAKPSTLEDYFSEAINHPDIVGLAVSTRPDCIPADVVDLLTDLNKRTFMWVELGLQTANDYMLQFLERRHSVDDFVEATKRLHRQEIDICAHIILGLPDERDEDILKTALLLNELKIEGVKIHNLHVLKETKLEDLFNDGKVTLPSLNEYARRVAFFLENLDPKILIHRLNSHSPRRVTVAPDWSVNKLATFNAVEDELKRQDTWQGKSLGYSSLGKILNA